MRECHIVLGPPAAGKTVYGRLLAEKTGACFLDSDEVTERVIRAGLKLAGRDPDDRDSPAYKTAFRDAVYETLFALARTNLPVVPVVMAGPFTREGGDPGWLDDLERRLGVRPVAHFVWCDHETRRQRMTERSEQRDRPKLAAWGEYVKTCREQPPVWEHHFVDTSSR